MSREKLLQVRFAHILTHVSNVQPETVNLLAGAARSRSGQALRVAGSVRALFASLAAL